MHGLVFVYHFRETKDIMTSKNACPIDEFTTKPDAFVWAFPFSDNYKDIQKGCCLCWVLFFA